MNYEKINQLVAEKVMGWEPVYDDGDIISFITEYGTLFFSDDDECEWNPSTDIQDAWQVVEKLKIAVIPQAGDPPTDMKYLAEIDRQPFGDNYEAYAGTAELAICLVALKAVGVEIDMEVLE
ncbi:BC1872 family protein [Bacillus smithii]|uniref:BC1872 family protein n=1 Tax=Bacillus smithii TaxID=1479 RepID=UPI003D1D69F9